MKKPKKAIIFGAGPAGLTAAYELIKNTDIEPIIFEASDILGGISRTENYKGNRIDIGGHRFFSKSDIVMKWWSDILPIESSQSSKTFLLKYRGSKASMKGGAGPDPKLTDDVMLIRSRLSRIYYGKKFYDYPITLSYKTIQNLGYVKIVKIGISYLYTKVKKVDESNLEGFYINRFGRELYNTFFASYTEKLWGIPPKEIDSSWGAQRIKGLSISKILIDALSFRKSSDISQKKKETSLIEYFLYPKLGPGYLWEKVASIIEKEGGIIKKNHEIKKIHVNKGRVIAVDVLNRANHKLERISGDYFFSTIPVKELISSINGDIVPKRVSEIAQGLPYRDFITVGILANKLQFTDDLVVGKENNSIQDNWIYIQEPDVKVCRLQIFNNWSPYLVKDKTKIWVGTEYVVSENDEIWKMSDDKIKQFAIDELQKINIIKSEDVIDSVVIKLKKTYPAYFGTYNYFNEVKEYIDKFDNLFLIGRNGQHRYNNQDHSMLTAIEAVNNIKNNIKTKDNIWNVNVEKSYHEEK